MSIIASLIGPVSGILDKVIPDSDMKAKLAHEIATMSDTHAQQALVAQLEINKVEAKGNWFQASWRPLCGYTCVLGLMVNFLISPICAGFGFVIPQAEMSTMLPILTGMLGLAGMRSFEKVKKVSK